MHKANIGGTKYIFNVNPNAQPLQVVSMYCESTLSLGFIGPTSSAGNLGAVIMGSTFDFHSRGNKEAVDTHLMSWSPVELIASKLCVNGRKQPVVFFNKASLFFRSCIFLNDTVGPGPSADNTKYALAFHDPTQVSFENTRMADTSLAGTGFGRMSTTLGYTVTGELARNPVPSASYAPPDIEPGYPPGPIVMPSYTVTSF